ncbi:MAG: RNA methyltransferase [Gammaproteobacteria bacterium]|nr:RNA methyltransferase [Gammaproteobacteria bacterium]MBU1414970.1 RNA methyltransferase [Gammaproteobacteria bacterium]
MLARTRAVTSRDNPVVKRLRALATDAREIRSQGRTLLDGPHLIEAYQRHGGIPEQLVVSESGARNPEILQLLEDRSEVGIVQLSDSLFREVSGVVTPVGILAVVRIPDSPSEPLQTDCVFLDAIQDAGNVGTILRTAAAANIRDVVLGRGCAGAWSPRVLRAAQGAHFGLHIREQGDLTGLLRNYAGTSIATVANDGTSLFDLDLKGKVAWIFGNEGAGLNDELLALALRRTSIPMSSNTESLNVAAAAAICLFEQVRQRRLSGGERKNA